MMFGRSGSPEIWESHKRPRTSKGIQNKSTSETMDRETVLATLGYKPEKSWKTTTTTTVLLEKSELCIRCGKKVYPVEKVDVGGLYHRSCFRCKTCNVQLNLRTFHRDVDPLQPKATREIYCKAHVPLGPSGHVDAEALEIRRALDAQKHVSSHMRGTGYEHTSHYTTDALEFRHQSISTKRRKKIRRRSTLRSYKDFEKFGVFDAQSTLEELHRKEEDELYKQMAADRKRHVDKLERHIAEEKKRTVAELIAWFDKRAASEQEKTIGIRKIENFYRTQREQRIQLLMHRLTMEEQAAVARMIEKHSQEMLILIQQKEREAEKAMHFQFRESQIFDDNDEAVVSGQEYGECYSEEEEWDEDESQDVTESFSEASYQVEQCENVSGVVQSEHRVGSPDITGKEVPDIFQQQNNKEHVRRQPQRIGTRDELKINKLSQQYDAEYKSQISNTGSVSSDVRNPQTYIRANEHQVKQTGGQSQAFHTSIQPQDYIISGHPQGHSSRGQPQAYHAGRPQTYQTGGQPYPAQPLTESNRGTSLSQRLLNVSPPFEYLQYGDDENGAVVVKVHAAQDAHLIDDSLRSHHYCTSPSSGKTFYDLTKSPKTRRPESKSSTAVTSRSGSVDSPRTRGSVTSSKRLNGVGKYMLFQRPEDVQDVDSSDEDQRVRSSSSLNLKHDRERNQKRGQTNGEDMKRKSKSLSHDKLRTNIDEEFLEDDPDERFHDMMKSHADRARAALRTMSLGVGDDTALSPQHLFPDPSPIAPKVAPPKTKKSTLYTNPSVFKEFDENAIKETKRDHKTFTDLVRQLSKHCESELQRVRSIFRWITAKDLNKLQFADNLDSDTPMGLLRGIKLGVESYHNLFKRLCSYAGLHCEIIEGYSKGAGYKPGSRIRGNAFRNQWTAVFIDGAWRFVNCNWGARHVKGPRDERMTYKCDEFYFLTDPEDHIYQHFPDDPDWQLLPKPISLDQFVKLPLLKSPFFNKHLALASEYESVIHSSEGGDEVRIISPSSLCFGAQLKSKDGDVKPEMLQDRMLVRRLGEEIIFLTKLPSAGKYFLEIYCGDSVDADSMDNVCSFRICCYSVLPNTHISFPPASCFGRTPAFASFDIKEETHSDPYVIQSGQLLIAFICQSNLKLSHSLTLWNHRDRKLEEYDRYAFAVHRSEHMVSYAIHCPKRGGYVFSMFASDEQRVDPKCIYRYYIECSSPTENTFPLPKASKRWQHCRLIDPLNGNLPLRSRVRFRIESAVAVEIVVNVNGTWHGLHKSGNMWQGSVNTGENRTKLSVYGRFDKSKEKYVPLLEYQVKGTRGIEELKSPMNYV